MFASACRTCAAKSSVSNAPLRGFQPIWPASTTQRPLVTSPSL